MVYPKPDGNQTQRTLLIQ